MRYSDNQIDYPGVGIITDEQVASFVKEHSHWWERLNYHRMCDYALLAQTILMGVITKEELPTKEKWFIRETGLF